MEKALKDANKAEKVEAHKVGHMLSFALASFLTTFQPPDPLTLVIETAGLFYAKIKMSFFIS